MTTGYITHPDFLKHEMGSHHPECPERIQAINDQLIRSGVDRFLHHLDAPLATEDQLELVHSPDHVSFVRDRAPESGYFMLDGDTIMNPHTYRVALRAAGAAIAGVDAVKHLMHMRLFLRELGQIQDGPSVVYEDNQAAISLAHNNEQSKRAKHYQLKVAFLSDQHKRGVFRYVKVGTKAQLADSMTKALPRDDFVRFRDWMGVRLPSSSLELLV
jgi:hypothetical protein